MTSVFSFQSDLLNPESAATGALRTIVGTDGVSLWAKSESGKTLALKSWNYHGKSTGFDALESEMRMVLGGENVCSMPFGSTVLALSSAHFTLMPRRLFDPADLSQYFKLLLPPGKDWSYGFEAMTEFDCFLVWAEEPGLAHLCKQYFSNAHTIHLAAPLLRGLHALAPSTGYAVFANLRGQSVQVAVFERQSLVFFNKFDFTKPSDLLYFVLLAYEQFRLNPLEIPLTLSGSLSEDSEAYKLLLRYIRPLRSMTMPAALQLPEEANILPVHYWFDLSTI